MAFVWAQRAAVEVNTVWHERVSRLPVGAVDLIDEPSDDEIAAIIEKHCPEAAK
jgi:hypothetical protein